MIRSKAVAEIKKYHPLAGLDEVYDGRPPRGFDTGPYVEAEKEARETGRGMWIQG